MAYSKKEREAHAGPRKKRREDLKITRLDKAKYPKHMRERDPRFDGPYARKSRIDRRVIEIELERMRTTGKRLKDVRIPKSLRTLFGTSKDS